MQVLRRGRRVHRDERDQAREKLELADSWENPGRGRGGSGVVVSFYLDRLVQGCRVICRGSTVEGTLL